VELEPEEHDLLVLIYQAERRWADAGHDDRNFLLIPLGGMQRDIDHPGWDRSAPVPTSRQIDDLEEHGLLRVAPHAANNTGRSFELSSDGRRIARSFINEPKVTESAPAASPPPSPDDVLEWIAGLDQGTRSDGRQVLQAAIARFDPSRLDAVSELLFDLEAERLIKFLNPMATLTRCPASTRIGKSSDFRVTVRGVDRLNGPPTVTLAPTYNIGYVGQFAGRDITNQITITQEIVELALQEVDRHTEVDDATRRAARSLIQGAMGRGMDVLVAASGTDIGELALEAVKHVLRAKGAGI
jgi:DNA-binding MarR family transcriptional regulator